MDSETVTQPERTYAHFHRVLGSLLQELANLPSCAYWLSDKHQHVISGNNEHNLYARALYRVPSLEPYQPRLDELAQVQNKALAELGLKRPPKALLSPLVVQGVTHVRVHETTNYRTTPASKADVLTKIDSAITTTKRNLSVFERQGGVHDPETQRIARELEGYKAARSVVDTSEEAKFRVRLEQRRIRPYVYLASHAPIQADSRTHGLILVGHNIQVSPPHTVRRQRSDKRQATPVFAYGKTRIYFEGEWQEAGR